MHIDENWAVTTARARAFFDAQPDVIACALPRARLRRGRGALDAELHGERDCRLLLV